MTSMHSSAEKQGWVVRWKYEMTAKALRPGIWAVDQARDALDPKARRRQEGAREALAGDSERVDLDPARDLPRDDEALRAPPRSVGRRRVFLGAADVHARGAQRAHRAAVRSVRGADEADLPPALRDGPAWVHNRRAAVDPAPAPPIGPLRGHPLGRRLAPPAALALARPRDHGPHEEQARPSAPAAAGRPRRAPRARRHAGGTHGRVRVPVPVDDGRAAFALRSRQALPRGREEPRMVDARDADRDASDVSRTSRATRTFGTSSRARSPVTRRSACRSTTRRRSARRCSRPSDALLPRSSPPRRRRRRRTAGE
jgi:hypothetical protein